MNIPVRGVVCGLLVAATLQTSAMNAQNRCPPAADTVLESGWKAYRSDSILIAAERFTLAQRLCPQNLDALSGLGFTQLRQHRLRQADSLFALVLARDSLSADAWEGRARARARLGDTTAAVTMARRAVTLAPRNPELRAFLHRLWPEWERAAAGPRARPGALQLVARTRGQRFEILSGTQWQPFYLQGVNLGVALPGRHPSEFPSDSATYAGWLDTLAAMNANTVRVYTILPPSFYRALRGWNLTHPERVLWLVHGVWTELPPKHDFDHPAWQSHFQVEMRRVVDLVHGAARIPPRRGHASGQYDADVSPWVLAYIIGREWEPFAVKAYDARNPAGAYAGRFLQASRAPAMERWLARQCDVMLAHEFDRYHALRPIAYTNWPTLDPLQHPTEATTAEEASWRKRSGRKSEAKKLEYENDALGVDANLIQPTAANPAGWFASYHAYPYYPDFMMLDRSYQKARSSYGPSSYFGYLTELIEHHSTMPTVIAEYGVPSSRGVAHLHPQGWGHGGHDERTMAAIDARLTREIKEAGAAGAILFAWMDEWFKKNWAVIEYEIPVENTRLWHNMMDAEQNYGILGQYAGELRLTPRLGGDPELWRRLPLVQTAEPRHSARLRTLRAGADESYIYLALELTPGELQWDSLGLQIAIDTYQPKTGQHRLPRSGLGSELGFEFLVDLVSPRDATLRIIPEYNRYDARLDPATGDDFGRFSRRPVITRNRSDARFDSLTVVTNRARFGRDGRFYPALRYDRGRMRHGSEAESTLSDWYHDVRSGWIQIRLPWDLLNVTDPSSRTLLFDTRSEGGFGTVAAEDFHVGVVLYRKNRQPALVDALPAPVSGIWRANGFRPWRWTGWSQPRSHARLKPVYDTLRNLWRESPGAAQARPARRVPSN